MSTLADKLKDLVSCAASAVSTAVSKANSVLANSNGGNTFTAGTTAAARDVATSFSSGTTSTTKTTSGSASKNTNNSFSSGTTSSTTTSTKSPGNTFTAGLTSAARDVAISTNGKKTSSFVTSYTDAAAKAAKQSAGNTFTAGLTSAARDVATSNASSSGTSTSDSATNDNGKFLLKNFRLTSEQQAVSHLDDAQNARDEAFNAIIDDWKGVWNDYHTGKITWDEVTEQLAAARTAAHEKNSNTSSLVGDFANKVNTAISPISAEEQALKDVETNMNLWHDEYLRNQTIYDNNEAAKANSQALDKTIKELYGVVLGQDDFKTKAAEGIEAARTAAATTNDGAGSLGLEQRLSSMSYTQRQLYGYVYAYDPDQAQELYDKVLGDAVNYKQAAKQMEDILGSDWLGRKAGSAVAAVKTGVGTFIDGLEGSVDAVKSLFTSDKEDTSDELLAGFTYSDALDTMLETGYSDLFKSDYDKAEQSGLEKLKLDSSDWYNSFAKTASDKEKRLVSLTAELSSLEDAESMAEELTAWKQSIKDANAGDSLGATASSLYLGSMMTDYTSEVGYYTNLAWETSVNLVDQGCRALFAYLGGIVAGELGAAVEAGQKVGEVVGYASIFGRSRNEVLREGYSASQANIMGAIDVALEKISGDLFDGLNHGGNILGKGVTKALTKNASSVVRDAVDIFADPVSEGLQEMIQDPLEKYARNIVLGEDNEVLVTEDIANSGLIGFITAMLFSVGNVYGTIHNGNVMTAVGADISFKGKEAVAKTLDTIINNPVKADEALGITKEQEENYEHARDLAQGIKDGSVKETNRNIGEAFVYYVESGGTGAATLTNPATAAYNVDDFTEDDYRAGITARLTQLDGDVNATEAIMKYLYDGEDSLTADELALVKSEAAQTVIAELQGDLDVTNTNNALTLSAAASTVRSVTGKTYTTIKNSNPDKTVLTPAAVTMTENGVLVEAAIEQGDIVNKVLEGEDITLEEASKIQVKSASIRKSITDILGIELDESATPEMVMEALNNKAAAARDIKTSQQGLKAANEKTAEAVANKTVNGGTSNGTSNTNTQSAQGADNENVQGASGSRRDNSAGLAGGVPSAESTSGIDTRGNSSGQRVRSNGTSDSLLNNTKTFDNEKLPPELKALRSTLKQRGFGKVTFFAYQGKGAYGRTYYDKDAGVYCVEIAVGSKFGMQELADHETIHLWMKSLIGGYETAGEHARFANFAARSIFSESYDAAYEAYYKACLPYYQKHGDKIVNLVQEEMICDAYASRDTFGVLTEDIITRAREQVANSGLEALATGDMNSPFASKLSPEYARIQGFNTTQQSEPAVGSDTAQLPEPTVGSGTTQQSEFTEGRVLNTEDAQELYAVENGVEARTTKTRKWVEKSRSTSLWNKNGTAKVSQVRSYLGLDSKNGRLSKEEARWLQLDDFFSERSEVSYDELMDFLDANQLVIETKTLTDEDIRFGSYAMPGGENQREILFLMPDSDYTNDDMANHWGNTKGVLAHARVNDRVMDGKRTLFIEEIQSDWHNRGRDVGYQGEDAATVAKKQTKYFLRELHAAAKTQFGADIEIDPDDFSTITEQATVALANIYAMNGRNPVGISFDPVLTFAKKADSVIANGAYTSVTPNAPFSDNYEQFVMKSMVKDAIQNGYDRIAWSTAAIQSDRWSDQYNEGYTNEYDQTLPSAMNKLGKQFGITAKLENMTVSPGTTKSGFATESTPESTDYKVWTFDINDKMSGSLKGEPFELFAIGDDATDSDPYLAQMNARAKYYSSEAEQTITSHFYSPLVRFMSSRQASKKTGRITIGNVEAFMRSAQGAGIKKDEITNADLAGFLAGRKDYSPEEFNEWYYKSNASLQPWVRTDSNGNYQTKWRDWTYDNGSEYMEIEMVLPQYQGLTTDSMQTHWGDNRDVAFHMRAAIQTLSNGEQAFHIEEAQSDLANAVIKDKSLKGAYNAPYLETYPAMAVRMAVAMAKERGLKYVTWTPPEAQAIRWSYDFLNGYNSDYKNAMEKEAKRYGTVSEGWLGNNHLAGYTDDVAYMDADTSEVYTFCEQVVRKAALRSKLVRFYGVSDDTDAADQDFVDEFNRLTGMDYDSLSEDRIDAVMGMMWDYVDQRTSVGDTSQTVEDMQALVTSYMLSSVEQEEESYYGYYEEPNDQSDKNWIGWSGLDEAVLSNDTVDVFLHPTAYTWTREDAAEFLRDAAEEYEGNDDTGSDVDETGDFTKDIWEYYAKVVENGGDPVYILELDDSKTEEMPLYAIDGGYGYEEGGIDEYGFEKSDDELDTEDYEKFMQGGYVDEDRLKTAQQFEARAFVDNSVEEDTNDTVLSADDEYSTAGDSKSYSVDSEENYEAAMNRYLDMLENAKSVEEQAKLWAALEELQNKQRVKTKDVDGAEDKSAKGIKADAAAASKSEVRTKAAGVYRLRYSFDGRDSVVYDVTTSHLEELFGKAAAENIVNLANEKSGKWAEYDQMAAESEPAKPKKSSSKANNSEAKTNKAAPQAEVKANNSEVKANKTEEKHDTRGDYFLKDNNSKAQTKTEQTSATESKSEPKRDTRGDMFLKDKSQAKTNSTDDLAPTGTRDGNWYARLNSLEQAATVTEVSLVYSTRYGDRTPKYALHLINDQGTAVKYVLTAEELANTFGQAKSDSLIALAERAGEFKWAVYNTSESGAELVRVSNSETKPKTSKAETAKPAAATQKAETSSAAENTDPTKGRVRVSDTDKNSGRKTLPNKKAKTKSSTWYAKVRGEEKTADTVEIRYWSSWADKDESYSLRYITEGKPKTVYDVTSDDLVKIFGRGKASILQQMAERKADNWLRYDPTSFEAIIEQTEDTSESKSKSKSANKPKSGGDYFLKDTSSTPEKAEVKGEAVKETKTEKPKPEKAKAENKAEKPKSEKAKAENKAEKPKSEKAPVKDNTNDAGKYFLKKDSEAKVESKPTEAKAETKRDTRGDLFLKKDKAKTADKNPAKNPATQSPALVGSTAKVADKTGDWVKKVAKNKTGEVSRWSGNRNTYNLRFTNKNGSQVVYTDISESTLKNIFGYTKATELMAMANQDPDSGTWYKYDNSDPVTPKQTSSTKGSKKNTEMESDALGRGIAKKLSEYMAKSKARDSKGRLVPVYKLAWGDGTNSSKTYMLAGWWTDKPAVANTYRGLSGADAYSLVNQRTMKRIEAIQSQLAAEPNGPNAKALRQQLAQIERKNRKYFKGATALDADKGVNAARSEDVIGGLSIMEAYVNIERPLELNARGKDIDWVREQARKVVYNPERRAKYDGMIIKNADFIAEGATLGGGSSDLSTIYVTFETNQGKSIRNTDPHEDSHLLQFAVNGMNTGYTDGTLEDLIVKMCRTKDEASALAALGEYFAKMAQGLPTPEVDDPVRLGRVFQPQVTAGEKAVIQGQLNSLIAKYGLMPEGEKAARTADIPNKTGKGQNVRRFIRTAVESKNTSDVTSDHIYRMVLTDAGATYTPITDKQAISYADRQMRKRGYDAVKASWDTVADIEHTPTKQDIAMGEMLFMEAAKVGDYETAMKVLGDIAEMGTTAGQVVQAMSLLKKMSPSGQLYYFNRVVDRLNNQYRRSIDNGRMEAIVIDRNDAVRVMKAQTQEELDAAVEILLQNIANQMPTTLNDKWNAWRYLAMLGNPRTHIRNLVGNAVFVPAKLMKDLIAAGLEYKFVAPEERTKSVAASLGKISPEIKDFAQQDYEVMANEIQSGGKYNPENELQNYRTIFGNGLLEKLRKANGNLLEAEDALFLKAHYTQALASYLTAHNANVADLQTTKDGAKLLNQARTYAVHEAQKATYRDFSKLSHALNYIKRTYPVAGKLLDGLVPFTKTPANILARGIEYSPVGLMRSMTLGLKQLKSGDINAAEFIDGVSSGMTGTMIAALGAFLASLGIARGGDDDDDEKQDNFDELQGYQEYSITIGNLNYTIDWAAPVALPFFVGVEFYNQYKKDGSLSITEFLNTLSIIAEPITSLSMLDGLSSALESAKYDNAPIASIITTMATSYLGQGVPTLLSQISRAMVADRRSTYIDKNSDVPSAWQRWWQSTILGRTPLNSTRMSYVDAWGRTDTTENVAVRLLENMLSPGYINWINTTPTDEELQRLADELGSGVLVQKAETSFSWNSETVNLTADQYEQLSKTRGQTAYAMMTDMINSEAYSQLSSDDARANALAYVLDYATYKARQELYSDYSSDTAGWIEDCDGDESRILTMALLKGEASAQGVKLSNSSSAYEFLLETDWLDTVDQAYAIAEQYYLSQNYITDSTKSKYQFTITTEQRESVAKYYRTVFPSYYVELASSDEWKYADTATRLDLLSDLRTATAAEARSWLENRLRNAGYESVPKS